jgi:hypothetical protein
MILTIPRHTKQLSRVERMQRKSNLNAKQHANLKNSTISTNFSKCLKKFLCKSIKLLKWMQENIFGFCFYDANTIKNELNKW